MSWLNWIIVCLPLLFVLGMGLYARHYVRSVADYLAAGRVAGRYVLSVADMTAGLSAFTLVALCEINYNTGFAMSFWGNLSFPLGIFLSLTGFVTYRFRQTCALSGGQFLEMRYSRGLRIFATIIRVSAEILTNCIAPAVAVRFLIYLLGIPMKFELFGHTVSSFILILIFLLGMALFLILNGGRISLLVTDCIQGLISYPIFVIFFVFIITSFSWNSEIIPTMTDRVAGESFLNPYDVHKLRDFNMFSLIAGLIGTVLGRGLWLGNDASTCARTPHEQKMAGMLGQWRTGFSTLFSLILIIAIITIMNHVNYADQAREIRQSLTEQVVQELKTDDSLRSQIVENVQQLPAIRHEIGVDAPLSRTANPDTEYLAVVHKTLTDGSPTQESGNFNFQIFRSLYYQMMLPSALQKFLPPSLIALLIVLIVMLVVSTDDSRIFNSASAIIQDMVIPFCKKPLSTETHVRLLKWMSVAVTAIFFIGSIFLAQLDFLQLFIVITISIWGAGAGCVITFGLYSKRGTTAGAYTALILGGGLSTMGMIAQRTWALHIYPFIDKMGWTETVGHFLENVSRPFNPWIIWKMDAVKFPMNSIEISFIAMTCAVIGYWVVSMITYKEPYNLDRLLHRGKYSADGKPAPKINLSFKKLFDFILSITPDYTKGDKVIAWSVMGYSIIYTFIFSFIGVVILHAFDLWPTSWWKWYFLINTLILPAIIAVITTIWFMIGGIIDMHRLFKDLKTRQINALDNGMVEGGVSLADKEMVTAAEKNDSKEIQGIK